MDVAAWVMEHMMPAPMTDATTVRATANCPSGAKLGPSPSLSVRKSGNRTGACALHRWDMDAYACVGTS